MQSCRRVCDSHYVYTVPSVCVLLFRALFIVLPGKCAWDADGRFFILSFTHRLARDVYTSPVYNPTHRVWDEKLDLLCTQIHTDDVV